MFSYTYASRCCDEDMYVGSTLASKRRVIEHEEGKVLATAVSDRADLEALRARDSIER